jgi:hypothetical protein
MSVNAKIFIIKNQNAQISLDLNTATYSTTNTAVIGGSATAAINFPKAGGSTVQITSAASEITFDNRSLGLITFTLTTTKSNQLMVAPQLDFDVVITDSGINQVYRYQGLLEVKAIAVS